MKTAFKLIAQFILVLLLGFIINQAFKGVLNIGSLTATVLASVIVLYFFYKASDKKKEKIKGSVELDMLETSYKLLNTSNEGAFAFMLRPFGNDGAVNRRSEVDRFVNMHIEEDSVERKICEKIESNFYVKVIALADQSISKVPQYPKFYTCKNDQWKWHAELLLKRCLFVVIYIPHNTLIRSSLRWEILTAMCVGLRSRVLVLYPDHWESSSYNAIVETLKSQLSFIDSINSLSHRSIGFIIKGGVVAKQYILEKPKGIGALMPMDYKNATGTLAKFLDDMMTEMKSNIDEIPEKNLYAFRDTDLLDFEFDLTGHQMKILYESKENTFDVLGL